MSLKINSVLLAAISTLLLSACSTNFTDEAYGQVEIYEQKEINYLNLSDDFDRFIENIELPISDDDVALWNNSFERKYGVFKYIGTNKLSVSEKKTRIEFLSENRELISEIFEVVDSEIDEALPQILSRNSQDDLSRVRIVVAPFLQRTNGSVGVTFSGEIVYLLGADRLAYNVLERGKDITWVKTVVAHEAVHVSHFATTEYATSARRQAPLYRSVWIEGLAIYGSANQTENTYSIEDVFGREYANTCNANINEWAGDYLNDLNSKSSFDIWWRDNGQDPRGYGIVTPGYCIAYHLIEHATNESDFEELLELEPETAYNLVEKLLADISI